MPTVIARWNLMRIGFLFAILTSLASCYKPASQKEDSAWTDTFLVTAPEEDRKEKDGGAFHTSASTIANVEIAEEESEEGVVPAPPSSLRLLFINISAVEISWMYSTLNDRLNVTFLLQISHNSQTYRNITSFISSQVFVYGHMVFGNYYQFRVLACSGGVVSDPIESDYFINGVTAPPGPPVGIRVVIVSPWELTVQWEVPATPTPPVYIISWTSPENGNNTRQVYQATHVGVEDLVPESSVYVRVKMDISGRQSVWSPWVNVTMPPPYVPAPVIVNHTLSTNWVWLEWQIPSDQRFFNYQVSVFTLCYHGDSKPVTSNLSSPLPANNFACPPDLNFPCTCEDYAYSNSSGNVTDLASNTTYHFVMMYGTTVAARLSSLWSKEVVATTAVEPRLQCVSCRAVSATQLQLQWSVWGVHQLQSLRVQGCHGNDSVSHSNASIYSEVSFHPPLPSSAGIILVNDLRPWMRYSLALFSDALPESQQFHHDTCCPTQSCITMESVPSAAPANVIMRGVSSHSVSFSLTPPPHGMLNGQLIGYDVHVTCLDNEGGGVNYECGGTSDQSWRETGGKTSQCEDKNVFVRENATTGPVVVEVKGLQPARSYYLQVSAVTGGGRGPYSLNMSFQTPEEAYEDHPDCLQLEAKQSVQPSASRLKIAGNCVEAVLTLQWSFPHQRNSSVNPCNNVWLTISSANILPTICLARNASWNYCICLDPGIIPARSNFNFSFSILNDSVLKSLFPADWNGILWVWLDTKAELANGSVLSVTSKRLNVGDQVTCPIITETSVLVSLKVTIKQPGGPRPDNNSKLSYLAITLPIATALLMTTLVCITSGIVCIYRHWKRTRRRRVSEISMSQYHRQSPLAIWNDYMPLRTADGRSSSCSSEQSLATVSTGMTCSNSMTTSEGSCNRETDSLSSSTSSIVELQFSAAREDGQFEICEDNGSRALVDIHGGRYSPDGCSISSDDRDFNKD